MTIFNYFLLQVVCVKALICHVDCITENLLSLHIFVGQYALFAVEKVM